MDADVEVSLTAEGVTVEASDAALLRAIDSEGSLNAAASALGRSYSRAHKRLTVLEEALGPLVDRERGGEGGGGSALTERGHETLARFARARAILAGTAGVEQIAIPGTVQERSGQLVTVESAAGELRALAVDDVGEGSERIEVTDDVTITLTADAVTLQDPSASPGGDRTSARNRLRGTVTDVAERDGTVTVSLDVGTATPLSVLVTAESCERLGLADGTTVVATFKATAARATSIAGE